MKQSGRSKTLQSAKQPPRRRCRAFIHWTTMCDDGRQRRRARALAPRSYDTVRPRAPLFIAAPRGLQVAVAWLWSRV